MTVVGIGAAHFSTAWCKKLSRTNEPDELYSSPHEPKGKRRRLNQDINLPQFDCPSDAQLSQYQDTSQSGNRVLSTARDMVNGLEEAEHSHRDAEHFRTQTHEGVFSRPSQWEDAAALMPLASNRQQSGPEAYPSGMESNPPTGQAFFTTEVGVQGMTNLGMSK